MDEPAGDPGAAPVRLQIFGRRDCPGWDGCVDAAAFATRLGVPDLAVELVDLGSPGAPRPASVFAVPAYVLQGRLVAIGNPGPQRLAALLGVPENAGAPAEGGEADGAAGGP